MRFLITLEAPGAGCSIPVNYSYPLSAAIYHKIATADEAYASFLHEKGYTKGHYKSFKLFTFSDINTPFRIVGDRLILKTNTATFTACFHIPEAASDFVQGLFLHQSFDIADTKSRTAFTIRHVVCLPAAPFVPGSFVNDCLLSPISPIVCGVKNERGNYDFLVPDDDRFVPMLVYNLKEKYAALHGDLAAEEALKGFEMTVAPGSKAVRSRLTTIKAGTPGETKIRGFTGFGLRVSGSAALIELMLDGGIGVYNSQGMGCMEVK